MTDSQQTYRSTIGKGILLISLLLVGTFAFSQFYFLNDAMGGFFTLLISFLLFSALYLSVRYRITGHQLKVTSLFTNREIDIFQISSLQAVSSYLQQPFSFSEKRIRIIYNYGDYVDVSPRQANEFIERLLEVNPTIQYQEEASLQE